MKAAAHFDAYHQQLPYFQLSLLRISMMGLMGREEKVMVVQEHRMVRVR